jgi:cell division protein ZipA
METQSIQYFIAALLVAFIVVVMLRKRAKHLHLRIEPVSKARLDNTPVERNEIVGEVRVRARVQTRIEPTVDEAVNENPAIDVFTMVHSALSTESESVLTQEDMFPSAAAELPESTLAGSVKSALAFDLVISIHIMARTKVIEGQLLLEHLLQYGLRFGDMEIFHRHEHPTGQGCILFSLAQAMEPGTFDIDTLARDSVPGVSLFLGLPGVKSIVAYDLMIDTARRLAKALQADMLDDQGQILTAGKLADWRDEVVAFDNQSRRA